MPLPKTKVEKEEKAGEQTQGSSRQMMTF